MVFWFPALTRADYYGSENLSNSLFERIKEEGKDFITWCTISKPEFQKCQKLANVTVLDKGLFGKDYVELRCKQVIAWLSNF